MLLSHNMKKLISWIVTIILTVAVIMLFYKLGAIQFFGWVYSLAFALSALPQAKRSIVDGHTKGVADGTLALWMLGEVGGLIYGIGLMQAPIILNCLVNTVFVGIILKYRLFPRKGVQNDVD